MKKYFIIVLLSVSCFLHAQVHLRDTVICWNTFKYSLNNDNTMNWNTGAGYDTTGRTLNAYVLENEYLKVTLLPGFGGRILSMIYKPTGKEQLYQNPAGAPYGVGEDWFYYKWLMVYGGIFPTLTEPEHGKAWLLPWQFTIIKQSPDTICCRMSWIDSVDLEGIDTGKWKYGKTNLKCDFDVTLITGASALETDISLYNDSGNDIEYEYWTCLTLAPGSIPGNTKCTEGAELIIPASKIKIPSWYPDIARQEQRLQSGIYTFTKLRRWKNWPNDGIAYAWDDVYENYWGVIDHSNEQGLIRIGDNTITKGIKMWAWGYQQSQDINPFANPAQVRRPYVELWAGHSREFFQPAYIVKNSVKKWKEIYFPTVGITDVSNADYEIIADAAVNEGTIDLKFITSRPRSKYNVILETTGHSPYIILDSTITPDPAEGNKLTVYLPDNYTYVAGDSIRYTITNIESKNSLSGSLSCGSPSSDVADGAVEVKEFNLYQNYPNPFNPATVISFNLDTGGRVLLDVFNVLGEKAAVLADKNMLPGLHSVQFNASELPAGVYIYRIVQNGRSISRKMLLLK